MRKRRTVTAVGSAVAVTASLFLAAGAAAAPAAPGADVIAVNQLGDLGRLGATVDADTADFAGLYIDHPHHTIEVFTAGGEAVGRARAALAAQHHMSPAVAPGLAPSLAATTGYTVTYIPVRHSQAALDAAARSVEAHRTIDGVPWNTAGPDPRANQVLVGVSAPTAALRAAVAREYGDLVEIVERAPMSDAVGHLSFPDAAAMRSYLAAHRHSGPGPHDQSSGSRFYDHPSWYGGDQILHPVTATTATVCTAGFPYTDPYYAPPQMLFAGHCGSGGMSWFSGDTTLSSQLLGITGWQTFSSGKIDAALITAQNGQTYAPDIFVRDSTYWPEVGEHFNNAGDAMCSDGSITQENCAGIIDSCNNAVWYGNVQVIGLCTVHSSNGSRLVEHGDSGGPVISGNPMVVRGVISGGNIGSSPGAGPGNILFFTPWEAVNNVIGGHACPC